MLTSQNVKAILEKVLLTLLMSKFLIELGKIDDYFLASCQQTINGILLFSIMKSPTLYKQLKKFKLIRKVSATWLVKLLHYAHELEEFERLLFSIEKRALKLLAVIPPIQINIQLYK